MRKKAGLLLVAGLVLVNFSMCAQKDNISDKDKTGIVSHPRILMFAGEEEAIKNRINTYPAWKTIHDIIIADCNSTLAKAPVERVLIGKRLLDKSREALRRIFSLSYGYRMTGNPQYLQRAEKEMLAVAAFTDWNPSHFLDVAEMTMGMAIGYDWLYNGLTPASRDIIMKAIRDKGINPSLDSKYNSWLKVTHNWNQVCNAGMTYGAMAIMESETGLANGIIKRAEESIRLPMQDYQPDGAYPEGYGYWGYGTSFNVMFISAWEKLYGKKFDVAENENFLKTSYYMVNMTGPTWSNFNYSDNGSGGGIHPAMFWLAGRVGDRSVLFAERKFAGDLKSAGDRLLPALMIWGSGNDLGSIQPPSSLFWNGNGKNPIVLMRASWTSPDAVFAGFKGGSPKVNHGHMDVGSFVMESEGIRWAMDFGAQDYNSLEQAGVDLWNSSQNSERWQVFRYNNMAHNTLTVNGQLQRVDGNALMQSTSNNPEFMFGITDLTSIYSDQLSSARRGVAIAGGKFVIVRDEITARAAETIIRWNLLTSATATVTGPNTIELSKNGKKLVIKVAEPATVTMKTWSTVSPNSYDEANPGTVFAGFEATIPANVNTAIEVCLIPGNIDPGVVTSHGSLGTWTPARK
ncbi:MAG: heparinase II/III family protein [Bacteroidales bacterium]